MLQKPRLKPPILQKQPLRRSIYTAFNVVLWMVRYSPVRKQSHGNKNSQSESRFGMVLVKWTIWCHFYDRKEYRPWKTVVDLLNSLTKEIHVKKKYLRLNCFLNWSSNGKLLAYTHDSQSEISPFGTCLLINISFCSNRKMKFLFVLLLVLCHRAAQNTDPSEYFALVRCFFLDALGIVLNRHVCFTE